MPGRLDFSFLLGGKPAREAREPEDPFRILLIGDFGGRAARGEAVAAAPAVRRVDFDEFEAVMAKAQPRATLAFGDERVELQFESLDDFHPDALLQRVEALGRLQQQCQELRDPQQAARLLGEVGSKPGGASAAEPQGSMFERLLGGARQRPDDAALAGLDAMLVRLVRPHLAPVQDPRVPDLLASLQATASGLLREVLHHPAFQQLESTWRGLSWLLQNVELDEELQVLTLDLTKAELRQLATGGDIEQGHLHRLLVERAGAGAQAYSLVVALHEFDHGEADVLTLAAMGALARRGGFAFVATAAPAILGCPSLVDAVDPAQWRIDAEAAARWQALRQSPQTGSVGLVLPRFLLRLPYGAATDRIDGLPFEESALPPVHEQYLWGQPGLAVAMLLARSFRDQGWQMQGIEHEVTGLPAHSFRIGDVPRMQPCAEVLWGERAVAAAADAGLMVLQSHANRDAARLLQLRSVAAGAAALAGPWC